MKFGHCDSFNLLKPHELFKVNNTSRDLVDVKSRSLSNLLRGQYFSLKWNETGLFKTPNKALGIDALTYRGTFFMPNLVGGSKKFFRVTFHTSYELPNENYQQFLITELESVMFLATPQIRLIDDSMLDLTPKEFSANFLLKSSIAI